MSIKVLLADDHAVVRDGLRLLLEAQGEILVVGEASDGLQAVHEIEKKKPDVVVMDISMPKLNGISALRRVLEVSPLTKVVILSMHASQEPIHRALDAGAVGYLLKESAGLEVADAVKAVQKGEYYFSSRVTRMLVDEYGRHQTVRKDVVSSLSLREQEVLQLVAEGKSSGEIAKMLNLSLKTVETYRSRIMNKLQIHNVPGLVKFAIQHSLISVEQTPPF